jgi:hypothetical protein
VQLQRARRQDRFLDRRSRQLVTKAQRGAVGEDQAARQARLDVVAARREHVGDEPELDLARHDRDQLQHLHRLRAEMRRRGPRTASRTVAGTPSRRRRGAAAR